MSSCQVVRYQEYPTSSEYEEDFNYIRSEGGDFIFSRGRLSREVKERISSNLLRSYPFPRANEGGKASIRCSAYNFTTLPCEGT